MQTQDHQPTPSQGSDPRYVTIPFEYYRTLVEHYYTVVPSAQPDEVFQAPDLNPTPEPVGEAFNLRGVDLFEEMPEGYRKLNDGD